MLETVLSYEDWRDFFKKKLLDTGYFYLSDTYPKGNTDTEVYNTLKGNPATTIEVGYFSSMTLIYLQILNPQTPGNNRQQEIEYLYKYEFDTEKQYGSPGLDFNEINVSGIESYLNQGFNGNEIVYYRNGKPVKSKLTTSYYPDSPKTTVTYDFDDTSFFKKLWDRILRRNQKFDEIKNIDLRDIFAGLNGN